MAKENFFCSGYDLKLFAQSSPDHSYEEKTPWDPAQDFHFMGNNNYPAGCTACYMSLFHSKKPTIAKIHGGAIAGGSDIALCCDLILMTKDSVIGYPPSRIWGVPTTAMWATRVGIQQAKRLLFTGELIKGTEATRIGLALQSYENKEILDKETLALAKRISSVPCNQLFFNKTIINYVSDSMSGGFDKLQLLSSLLDGAARHTPEGAAFKKYCEKHGFKEAIAIRDSNKIMNAFNTPSKL